jgi:hypothetical protein
MNSHVTTAMVTSHPGTGTPTVEPESRDASLSLVLEGIAQHTDKFRLRLEPRDFGEVSDVAKMCVARNLNGVQDIDDARMRIMLGANVGLPAVAAIQAIDLIETEDKNGKKRMNPSLRSRAKLGLCLAHPELIDFIRPVKEDLDGVTWEGRRKGGEVVTVSYGPKEAKLAGLDKRNTYQNHPVDMYAARAISRVADRIGSDIFMGLPSREDLLDAAEQQREERLAKASVPPTSAMGPARDWEREAAELEKLIASATTAGDKAREKAARELYQLFEKDAPPEMVDRVKAFYTECIRRKKGGGAAPQAEPTKPAQAAAAQAPPVDAAASQVPPEKRGDAWEGP